MSVRVTIAAKSIYSTASCAIAKAVVLKGVFASDYTCEFPAENLFQ